MKKFLNSKNIIILLIGLVIGGFSYIAADNLLIEARQVGFSSSKTQNTNLQAAVDELYAMAKVTMVDTFYPVGSIYMSVDSTNPGELFGGTWEAWGAGRVPVGVDTSKTEFDTVGKIGGSMTHNHLIPIFKGSSNAAGGNLFTNWHGAVWGIGPEQTIGAGTDYGTISVTGAASSKTGYPYASSPESTLQPYITCYMWKRTA